MTWITASARMKIFVYLQTNRCAGQKWSARLNKGAENENKRFIKKYRDVD